MNVGTKQVGMLIVAISLVILFAVIPLSLKLAEADMSQCVHATSAACSIAGHIPLESYIAFASVIILAGAGALLMLGAQRHEKMDKEVLRKIRDNEKKLTGDEKTLYRIVSDSNGALFQSDAVEKSGFGKVKVTRILDKLEAMGLIERRRRGMSNMVMLKNVK